MVIKIFCEHDKTELTLEQNVKKWKSDGYFAQCQKCKCVYRVWLIHNNNECFTKRFPRKPIPLKEIKKKIKDKPKVKDKESADETVTEEVNNDKGEL